MVQSALLVWWCSGAGPRPRPPTRRSGSCCRRGTGRATLDMETGAETVTMCPPQAPALDPAQGPPGAYGGAQDGRPQGDAGGGGAGGGAADRALGHQTGAEVGEQVQGLGVMVLRCRYERRGRPKLVTYWLARLRNYDDPVTLSDEHQGYRCHVIILCHVMSCYVMSSCHHAAGGRGWRRRRAWHQDTRQCSRT